ncbi:MAG TPA: glycolate oxidase subunit GlcF [Actinopolymorphaceae bacterium]|jgi:glycolate oxidase iron-sulfur subunit
MSGSEPAPRADWYAPEDAVTAPERGAFDTQRPPSAAMVADCVHCGFCLPACPTYVLWGEEMDSPRGRIDLIRQGLEGEPMTESMVDHWDACLGCMACMTACPSGVQYDRLIESTRAQVERHHPRTRSDRALRAAIFAVFPRPGRLRLLRGPLRAYQWTRVDRLLRRSGLLQRVAPRLAAMEALTPTISARPSFPVRTPAAGHRRAVVGLLAGCIQREFMPQVNAATVRVLAAEGCDVIVPATQGCCGALSAHNGRDTEAQGYARALIEAFEAAGVDTIVVNAAGCGSTMKEYADLLADDPDYAARAERIAAKVRDISEVLIELGSTATRHPLKAAVAYQDACHLAHAQGVRDQPRTLLRQIPGLDLREIADPELCCGSAGIYNILNPEPARDLGERKAAAVAATGASIVASANPGCLMQLRASLRPGDRPLTCVHTIELLDASIRGVPPPGPDGRPEARA